MVEKKTTMVYSQDGSYSFCLDMACVASTHIAFCKTSHMAKPYDSGAGRILLSWEGETIGMS